MQTFQITKFAQATFIAFFAGVVSCVLTMTIAAPSSRYPTPPDEASRMQQRPFKSTADALARIEAQIQDLYLVPPSEHTRREPVGDLPTDDVLAKVLERFDAFERRMASFGLVRAHAEEKPVQRNAPHDWRALDKLYSWNERDDDGASKSVALLTLPEVIDRFGTPSEVSGYDGRLTALFYRFGPTGEKIGTIALYFSSGYVSGLETDDNPD